MRVSLLVAIHLAAACAASAFDGRGAVTQYAWKNADCSGPFLEVLATCEC